MPPNIPTGLCEASYAVNVGHVPNPGEAETIRFFNPSDRRRYNVFFAVAGDAETGLAGRFDVEVDVEVGVVHCEGSLPGQENPEWPESVRQVDLNAEGEWLGEAELMEGACTNLDFAQNPNVACFPDTQNEHYDGNHLYFALSEPIPPRSQLTLTARPLDPELDISLYGVRQGTQSFQTPPWVLHGICETDNGHPAGNPGEEESIVFTNPSDDHLYNVFFAVAGAAGATEGQVRLSASLQVGEQHCPESLPGQAYRDRWPVTVQLVSLDEDGRAVVRGNLDEGACVNLEWAASGQIACFPEVRFDQFDGHHVYFALDRPLPPHTELFLRANEGVSVYAYTIGPDQYRVPPFVPLAVSCEYNALPGQEIRVNTVANPYNVFFAVAGVDGAIEGDFEVLLRTVQQ